MKAFKNFSAKKSRTLTWIISSLIASYKSGIIIRKYPEKEISEVFGILKDSLDNNTVFEGIKEFADQFIVSYNNLGCWIKLVLTIIGVLLVITLMKSLFKKILTLKERGDLKKIPDFVNKVRNSVPDNTKLVDKMDEMYTRASNRLKCDGNLILGIACLEDNGCYSGIRVDGIRKIKHHPAISDSDDKSEIIFSKALTLIAESCENAIYILGSDISDSTNTHLRRIRIDNTPQKVTIDKKEYIVRVF